MFIFFISVTASGQVRTVAVSILDSQDKEICRFEAEAAVTPKDQERGLMFRKYMPGRTGMIFINTSDQMHHFWMK
ncbi:MAG: DUF192 domain-containing protein, partial [Syntrophorhabdus sp.]